MLASYKIKHRHCGPKESDMPEWLDWTELNYDPAIPLRGVYPRDTKTCVHKHLCKNAPNSFIYDDKHLFIFFLVVHWFLIACTGEPGGLPSMGSHRVGHEWSDLAAAAGIIQQINKCCDPMDYILRGILQARILEWLALPFSRGSSQPKSPRIAGKFFTSWATKEAQEYWSG